tara:strand:+ start:3488 stop:3808 length:321 start_codon:yes stop_codon:yes gene_type:complete
MRSEVMRKFCGHGAVRIALIVGAVLIATPAMAQDASWVEPITDFLDVLTSGLGRLGAAVLGIGIVAIGLWAAWTGRMDWGRFGFALIGGILVMVGPELVDSLFGSS